MFSYRRRIKKNYEQLLDTMDKILAGEEIEDRFDESMDGAIIHRLKQTMDRVTIRQERAENERDKVKQLISDISHQVRTPLSNIVLYSQLLENSMDGEENAENLKVAEKISQNAEALSFQLQELLKAAYSEQEMIVVNPTKNKVWDIISGACQRAEDFALKKEILVQAEPDDTVVYADAKWTEEAIFNVIHNAIKYSAEKGAIHIHTDKLESFVCVRISDSGVGIPQEEAGAVCNRFYRGSNVSQDKGLGIGMYLTREVLQIQHGYIRIDSEEGKGTKVSLFLPRAE